MNPQPPPIPSGPPPLASQPPRLPPAQPAPQLDLRSISGAQGMSVAELQQAVAAGGKFVLFQYCISVLVLSFKRSSPITFVRPGESAFVKGLPYTFISFFFGWWGIPWGPIWSIITIAQNISGGKNLTAPVLAALGASMPIPSRNAGPLSPTEVADRAERESRKTLIMRLGLATVVILFLLGGYALYKIYQAGRDTAAEPGQAEFRIASKEIGSGGLTASGNNDQAIQLAAEMSRLIGNYRDKAYNHATRKSFMDQNDEFRTYCHVQPGEYVFLIHVPELRRFKPEAKQSLAESAWMLAEGLLPTNTGTIRLAVATRGIGAFDRVLSGDVAPGNRQDSLKPTTYAGFNCEKQLIPWFAPPSESSQQTSTSDKPKDQ